MSESTKVATVPSASNLPVAADLASRLNKLAGAGFEHAGKGDYSLPFIGVLQKMSPQLEKGHAKYIKGSEAGQFINTVTNELYDGDAGITVIPVDFRKVFLEWVPRNEGGGLVAEHPTREEADSKKQENTVIADTANHYVLMKTAMGWEPVLISCTSTKLKFSRNWMSQMARVRIGNSAAPMFARKYVLKTVTQSNQKGSFHNIKAEPIEGDEGWVSNDELDAAERFYQQIRSGKKGADYSTLDEVPTTLGADTEDADQPPF